MVAKQNVFYGILNKRRFRIRLFFEGIVVGLFSGVLVAGFRMLLQQAYYLLLYIYSFLGKSNPGWTFLWILCLLGIAYILKKISTFEPMAGGSGIPQVKGVVLRQFSMDWLRLIVAKFTGGILAIGAGLSLGREGPSIQLGAAVGQGVNRLFHGPKIEERLLITSGASAGLAAAFNAPLAGVIFSLEEIHKNFSPPVLLSAMAASITADFVSRQIFGIKPIFNFYTLPVLPMKYYGLLLVLGCVTGCVGALFNWSLIKTLDLSEKSARLFRDYKAVIPLLLTIPLGFLLPQALGSGHNLIESIRTGQCTIALLCLLFIIKFGFTMISYGSGAPGGIFLPLLVIGSLAGGIYSNLTCSVLNIDAQFANNFVVFAMAAMFTAVVKAPITGSILITEMTGSFQHLPALIIVSMTAYVVSDLLKSQPIYDQLLQRILYRKSDMSVDNRSQKKTLLEIVVSLGSDLDGRIVKDISLPSYSLLVGIRRGEIELIPRGDTKILAGDYLNVLTTESDAARLKQLLLGLAGSTNRFRSTEGSEV